MGQIGADKNGDIFQSLSQQQGIVFKGVINPEISTTSKERVIEMTYHQQLIRMDYENIVEIQESQMEDILSFLSDSPPDFIIISDYKKGCITEYFARRLIDTGIPIIVDTKPGRLAWFRGALAIKPNFKEFSEHIGVK
jgi:D-beta-D-heptose 7-phosphate kinase/D-beta-D-heptose 1-phosphate adenosyltransferase